MIIDKVWIAVIKARSYPSSPKTLPTHLHAAQMDRTSPLEVSSNNTLTTDLGILPDHHKLRIDIRISFEKLKHKLYF